MLLIITNSVDGSADLIVDRAAAQGLGVFRLNDDLLHAYELRVSRDDFLLRDPSGRSVTGSEVRSAYWRKPFLEPAPLAEFPATEHKWILGHRQAIVRGLAQWLRADRKLRLVDPEGDRRLGKVLQMRLAADLFAVPDWTITSGSPPPTEGRVAKTLVPEMIESERLQFMYTTKLPMGASLDSRYPWFVQDAIDVGVDATTVAIGDELFSFAIRKPRADTGTDWRVHIASDTRLEWAAIETPPRVARSCAEFLHRADLRFGRFDFIVNEECWHFLECNPNGQYGWLDDERLWLHQKVLDALLDESNTIQ